MKVHKKGIITISTQWGQDVPGKCWKSRFGAVGPSMLPKPGKELEWAHSRCCRWVVSDNEVSAGSASAWVMPCIMTWYWIVIHLFMFCLPNLGVISLLAHSIFTTNIYRMYLPLYPSLTEQNLPFSWMHFFTFIFLPTSILWYRSKIKKEENFPCDANSKDLLS